MNLLTLSDSQYIVLKNAYTKAVSEGKTQFTLWEQNILTTYARYLLEAIETHRTNQGLSNLPSVKYKKSHLCPNGTTYEWESRLQTVKRCPNCKNVLINPYKTHRKKKVK